MELNKCLSEKDIETFNQIIVKGIKNMYDSLVKFVKEIIFPFIEKYKKPILKMLNMEQYRKKQQRRMQLYKKRRAKYGKR